MQSFEGIFIESSKKTTNINRWTGTIAISCIALITRVLVYFASFNPILVEKIYSSTIYPYIAKCLGFISGLFSFSIAELLLLAIATLPIVLIFILFTNPKIIFNNASVILHCLVRTLALIYILFYFLWGFNYFRLDYMDITDMNKEAATFEELKELSLEMIHKSNYIRSSLLEDADGVFYISEDFQELSDIAELGFKDLDLGSINSDKSYIKAKPVSLSKYMSYTGIMGIYIPFTSEANVNIDIPNHSLLSTISHEMAHQIGFAKEDEANFIAYKANTSNPDERFQYSGYYLAMQHLINEVYRDSREEYFLLYNQISDAVKRDMDFSRDYWQSKEGMTEEIMTTMNDNYLKANNQAEGVRSYNLVVKLLLSEYKDLKAKTH